MREKSIFYTTFFLRSLSMIVGSLAVMVVILVQLVEQENYHPTIEGKIVTSHLRWEERPYSIVLSTSKHCWYTYVEKYFPILKEKAIVGKDATIWYNKKDHKIKKLIVDGEVVIPYYRGIGIDIFFLCLAIFILVINLIYIFKNPTHIAGRRK